MSAAAIRVPAVRAPRIPVEAVRLVAVLATGAFAFDRWMTFVARPPHGVTMAALGAAAFLGLVVVLAGRMRPGLRRGAVVVGAVLVALAIALRASGVPADLLDPRHWDELASGIGDGINALPGLNVPYRGVNQWARVVLILSGILLLLVAVVGAAWPRRGFAVAGLGVLYAIPAIELTDLHPWRSGALFALGLGAVLYADRVQPRQQPFAFAAVLLATLIGLAIAPRLDAEQPLIDVQKLATKLQAHSGETFSWQHTYGPLNWPQDGREVLRVKAKLASYWKAETLEAFDGLRWVDGPRGTEGISSAPDMKRHPEWSQRMTVTIGNMRTPNFIGAGDTVFVDRSPRLPVSDTAGSFVSAGNALQRGNAYRAISYYPRPAAGQLRAAPTEYGPGSAVDLTMLIADQGGTRVGQVLFPAWGAGGEPLGVDPQSGLLAGGGLQMIRRSAYGPMYDLAQRLRRGRRTPYDFALAVTRYLQNGFAYDQAPPRRPVPLAAFLFRDKSGYCQQFSGAMALLLRMGGVPARVAAGFSPGSLDAKQGDYVVRDTDAHSWVEAYFPTIGWVTFDPTPGAAPARRAFPSAASIFPTRLPGGERSSSSPTARADIVAHGEQTPLWRQPWLLVLIGLSLLVAAAIAIVLWLERRRHPPGDPDLAELERALRRAKRPPAPRTTLRDLERSLGPDEGVVGYFRAVRAARYGASAGAAPTTAQRRALRRVLGDGLGARGRLRALWAVPPRVDTWSLSGRRHPGVH